MHNITKITMSMLLIMLSISIIEVSSNRGSPGFPQGRRPTHGHSPQRPHGPPGITPGPPAPIKPSGSNGIPGFAAQNNRGIVQHLTPTFGVAAPE